MASAKEMTVAAYVAAASPEARTKLKELRAALKEALPDAKQEIKWKSIAFIHEHILFCFAAHKAHIGFYPTPVALAHFKKDLAAYDVGKGCVRFPLTKPLPLPLIVRIAKYRAKEDKKGVRWM